MDDTMHVTFMINSVYLLFAGVLVMWMIIGLTLFATGLVRAKNTVDVLLKNIAAFAIASVIFLLFSNHIMFSATGIIEGYLPDFHMLSMFATFPQVLTTKSYDDLAGLFYHLMLSIIPLSIICGATAERLRLWPFLFFATVMVAFIYPIQGFWIWGNGFLKQIGFIDQAGAGVIHLSGALAALAGVILLGPRQQKYHRDGSIMPIRGTNMPMAGLGVFIAWIGFFGFNGGALFGHYQQEVLYSIAGIVINTCLAGSFGLLLVMVVTRFLQPTVDLTLVLNGALVGLVSLSAAPAAPSVGGVILTSMIAALVMLFVILACDKLKIDDPVGAIAVHGVGGLCSLIGVAFIDDYAAVGWLHQLAIQLLGIGVIVLWTFGMALLCWFLIKLVMGLRIAPDAEYKGLDILGCGIEAYPEFTRTPPV